MEKQNKKENATPFFATPANIACEQEKPIEEKLPWYAVRLFTIKTQMVTNYFDEQQIVYFVPVEYVDIEDKAHSVKQVLRPVVRNLIFIKKNKSEQVFRHLMRNAPFKGAIIRKSVTDFHYYEISAREMLEFQTMCNPDIAMRKYLSETQAKLKKGAPVYVKYGPLRGLSGRLVRSNKKYFLLKEVPGMAVMLKVARWCCRPANT